MEDTVGLWSWGEAALRRRVADKPCLPAITVVSPTVHMPDRSQIDSVFGLYDGTLSLSKIGADPDHCALAWRAEVPWKWPSYGHLRHK